MKVEWKHYDTEEYCDDRHYCIVTLLDKRYELWIDDHTTDEAKENDVKYNRNIKYAYIVTLPPYFGKDAWINLGFKDSRYGDVGIDKIESLNEYDYNEAHCYIGKPKHTLDEVKKLVIQGFIDYFQFDCRQAEHDAMWELKVRKARMDEANAYLEEMK